MGKVARKPKESVFEWGGRRFKDQQGLAEILAQGYFREGHAWGSIRCGWEVAVDWELVWPRLVAACGSRMGAHPTPGLGWGRLASVPEQVKQGDMREEGGKLWLSMSTSGYAAAAPELWALCEVWLMGKSALSGPKGKAGKSGRGASKQANAAGPRRL